MLTRREFLESGCAAIGLSGMGALPGNARADVSDEAAQYRALVCIALGGGADSFNMLIPACDSEYRNYANRRAHLALTRDQLLPLPCSDRAGRSFALHHGMREIHAMYSAGDIALLANVGPLNAPPGHPDTHLNQDLSHSNLIAHWQFGTSDPDCSSGWAGRVADVFAQSGLIGKLPVNVSMSGMNAMQLGEHTVPADLRVSPYRPDAGLADSVDFTYVNEQIAERAICADRSHDMRRTRQQAKNVAADSRSIVDEVLADVPPIDSLFTSNALLSDLQKVASIIGARRRLGARRQIFFVQFDGWDHHHDLLQRHETQLSMLDQALSEFRNTLVEQGAFDHVTTFTLSEFGRSLESSRSGSDHGWGGHHIAMGGAVGGGRIYGSYPSLEDGCPLDIGGGCFVPTTSSDRYLAGLVQWLGVPPVELSHVLPGITKFANGLHSKYILSP